MIRLRLFGSLELCADDGRELRTVLAQPKRVALLAYLAAALPAGFHRRDRLLALFWPDQDDAHARGALNAAVLFLRREMGKTAIANRGNTEIGIEAAACWTDVSAFRAAMDAGRYAEALALYRGDFLDAFFADSAAPFEEWLERTRASLRADAARAARALAEERERDGNVTTAVSSARRAVELSDGDERVLRQLLQMLERLGDRAGAVLAYETFERRLAADLGVAPAPETIALIARIRNAATVDTESRRPAFGVRLEPSWEALRGWRVERELGRGGMATVYLARDSVHGRHVALKVMRPELVLSAGIEQFLREIHITARLAHPHILPLIDSGARDGVPYLVTPYVPGETLRARIAREGALPLGDAVRIATEIAEALDYAHRSGVVHRDVKPENVLLADGHALVADFGIARAMAASGADDATIAGSSSYMSPEQAAGQADVDARTDVYSLGCILLEMLTGELPKAGETASARLAERRDVPATVARLVNECVKADRQLRPLTAAHVLRRLENATIGNGAVPPATGPRRKGIAMAAAGGLALIFAAWSVVSSVRNEWSSLAMGPTRQITNSVGLELDPAISPDGKLIAYAAGNAERMRIFVRPMSGGDAVSVSGEAGRQHRWPTWSPDGSQLAFLATDGDRASIPARLVVVPALGGARRVLADSLSFFSTPSWSPDGQRVAYPVGDTIFIRDVNADGVRRLAAHPRRGIARALSTSTSTWAIHSLAWSPDGKRLAFVSGNPSFAFGSTAFGNLGPSSVWTISLDGSPPKRITTDPSTVGSPIWTPDGRGLLHTSNADGAWDVYFREIDDAGAPEGEARRLTTGLNAIGIGLSGDGSWLAYSLLAIRSNIVAASIRAGAGTSDTALRRLTDENQTIETVDVTPDGTWLVFDSNRTGRSHIYKMPVAGGDIVQLTNGPDQDFAPKWSSDGRRIAFMRRAPSKDYLRDVYVMSADGGNLTRLTADTLDDAYPEWAPDGRRVMFGQIPTGVMTSALRADGRWSLPALDTGSRGKFTSDGRYRLYTQRGNLYAQARNSQPRLLTTSEQLGGRIITIALGPDPTVVYFRLIDSTGVHSFHAVPVAGGVPRLVVRLDGSARRPARVIFSSDNRHLYFTVTEAESDVWVVALRR